mmetsp:Transcript_506/g.1667  ORF Transcript_506/g.1667 Transcript_506/m.1667 type:complete len:200 (+) Transcript_506:184-783(+)
MMRPSRLVTAWLDALRQRPRLINSGQGALLGGMGDGIAQTIEQRPGSSSVKFNLHRLLGAGAIGLIFSGFVYPPFYAVLDARWPGTKLRAVIAKACSDVALLGVFGNAASISGRLLVAGTPQHDILYRLVDSMPSVLFNELRVWLPYNLLAFRFVPTDIRPTSTAFITLCWQVYISWTAHASSLTPLPSNDESHWSESK